MMYKEPIGKVVDLVKVRRIIKRLPQYQVDADVVLCYLIDGAKTHFGEQGHTCFYRMQGKRADLLIFFNEKIKRARPLEGLPVKKSSRVYKPQECDWFVL